MSGALVARHLGSLPIVASASACKQHKLDKWVSFARKWQRENGGASSWVATSAERELLSQQGVSIRGKTWLLKVQVTHSPFLPSSRFMPDNCAACLVRYLLPVCASLKYAASGAWPQWGRVLQARLTGLHLRTGGSRGAEEGVRGPAEGCPQAPGGTGFCAARQHGHHSAGGC